MVQTKIDQISESTEFVFKSSEEKVLWQHWENLLKYPEDAGLYITVIPFAKRFALWMQYLMTKCDKPIYDIANYAMKSGHMDSIDFRNIVASSRSSFSVLEVFLLFVFN